MPSAIDPTFPADGAPVSKPVFREQLLTLRAELDHGGFVTNPVTLAESTASQALADLHAAMPASRVGTIAELQAIPPAPGLAVEVLGYHAPGDGGGGLFYADMTGALRTDGGIVFGHSGDESPEQTDPGHLKEHFADGFSLPHTDLVWGSVVVDPDDAAAALLFDDLHLNGHRIDTGGLGGNPLVDHETGAFIDDPQDSIRNYLNGFGTTTASVRYKYLTNPRRWVRAIESNGLSVRWFGAQEGQESRNRICWALNAAKRLGFREVRLDGDHVYRGSIEIPSGVTFGWGKLTVEAGTALRPMHNDYATNFPDGEVIHVLGGSFPSILPMDGATEWRLRDLELDGNYQNNIDPFQNPGSYSAYQGLSLEQWMQNTPTYSGVSATPHSARDIPIGQEAVIEDVHIHGYGSNCIVGYGNTRYSVRNLKLGDSVRNHLLYSVQGDIEGLRFYGFAWGAYGKTEHANIHGFRTEGLTGMPAEVTAWTGATQILLYEGLRRADLAPLSVIETGRWRRQGLNISGAHIDLDGFETSAGPLFYNTGPHFKLHDFVVLGPTTSTASEVRVLSENVIGNETAMQEGWGVKDGTLRQRGVPLNLMGAFDPKGNVVFSDITIEDHRDYEGAAAARSQLIQIVADTPRTGPAWAYPRKVVFEHIRANTSGQCVAALDVTDASATPVELVYRDCMFSAFTDSAILRSSASGTGEVSALTVQDLDKIRVCFERVVFAFPTSPVFVDLELLFALTQFRNCTTMDGLTSEDGGVADLVAAGGETHLDVPTQLLWAPAVVHVTPRSAAAARYAWVEVLASDGLTAIAAAADRRSPVLRLHFDQALGAGDTITVAWDAAVRPF